MKAAVLHEYGGPDRLKYEDVPDPKPGPGEILVRAFAASINPVDYKMRSGEAKERFPVEFPAILGRDVAGTVHTLGEGVSGFAPADHVMALTWHTYAEFVVVKVADIARVPDGLDLTQAGALPLVVATGEQLIRNAARVQKDQTVLVTGAVGSVGRVAVFAAQQLGAKVIAGVRKKQLEQARELGEVQIIALDDEDDMQRLGMVDAVADTVGGKVANALLAKVKPGGSFGSLLGVPKDAALHPTVQVNPMMAESDPKTLEKFAAAVKEGTFKIPIERLFPLAQAAEAQAAAEKGGGGKIVLVA